VKRLELVLATTSSEPDGAPVRPPVAKMAMHLYLDSNGLAKGWSL
jgi:hypothetical protein